MILSFKSDDLRTKLIMFSLGKTISVMRIADLKLSFSPSFFRSHFLGEDDPKSCCGVTVTQTVSIRWFIVMIAFVGICCSIVGTVLGAMKASGREHLTVSLLMIGMRARLKSLLSLDVIVMQ